MARVLALLGLVGLGGCGNPCQNVCGPMADYARECGLTVTAGDIKQCKDANMGEITDEQASVCQEFSDPAKLREWWTCDDVAENMTGAQ